MSISRTYKLREIQYTIALSTGEGRKVFSRSILAVSGSKKSGILSLAIDHNVLI